MYACCPRHDALASRRRSSAHPPCLVVTAALKHHVVSAAAASSGPSIYDIHNVQVFRVSDPESHAAAVLASVSEREGGAAADDRAVPSTLFVTWNLPTMPPQLLRSQQPSPGVLVVFQFALAPWAANALADAESKSKGSTALEPSLQLWIAFCKALGMGHSMFGRFKAIARVANIEHVNLPALARGYNAKPVLVKQSGIISRGVGYMEINVNVHRWGYQARRGLAMLMPSAFSKMVLQIGFLVEGRVDEELPEQLLGCVQVDHPTLDAAEAWPPTPVSISKSSRTDDASGQADKESRQQDTSGAAEALRPLVPGSTVKHPDTMENCGGTQSEITTCAQDTVSNSLERQGRTLQRDGHVPLPDSGEVPMQARRNSPGSSVSTLHHELETRRLEMEKNQSDRASTVHHMQAAVNTSNRDRSPSDEPSTERAVGDDEKNGPLLATRSKQRVL